MTLTVHYTVKSWFYWVSILLNALCNQQKIKDLDLDFIDNLHFTNLSLTTNYLIKSRFHCIILISLIYLNEPLNELPTGTGGDRHSSSGDQMSLVQIPQRQRVDVGRFEEPGFGGRLEVAVGCGTRKTFPVGWKSLRDFHLQVDRN